MVWRAPVNPSAFGGFGGRLIRRHVTAQVHPLRQREDQGQAQAAIGGVGLAVHAAIAVIALGQAAAIAARDFAELAAHVIAVDGLAAVKVGTTHQAAFADKQFI